MVGCRLGGGAFGFQGLTSRKSLRNLLDPPWVLVHNATDSGWHEEDVKIRESFPVALFVQFARSSLSTSLCSFFGNSLLAESLN